jgi:hypothetical protein
VHAQRLRPGRRAAEAQFETELDVFPRFFTAAGEGVDDPGAFQAKRLSVAITAAWLRRTWISAGS